ncbi:MAG: hypothetical protein A2309_09360 [Bacteroidetes bacterium RIFOXYB2_FULL_35_7]|nr:MAG: hypothetical protein A2X01_14850 [Bacteroidetes bacterium GWF2_35_48]OFY92888.1 MAG: hypothetical protein A2309_09360 [Bacteroidetes bacterium RIFOXYB2_FULL_35_7]OFY97175.1 MAG: hypothetical protein A2491_21415 [Bacteroidetes bacterium RIFOXYC12_FULL_35_7]HBX50126.1 hypothetical protein [Bacteroidales bacterium]
METTEKGRVYANGKAYLFDIKRENNKIIEIDFPREYFNTSHPVFQTIEKYFDDWIQYQDRDTKAQYFTRFEEIGFNTYLSKKEAVKGACEVISEFMIENNFFYLILNEKSFSKMDLDGYFQP